MMIPSSSTKKEEQTVEMLANNYEIPRKPDCRSRTDAFFFVIVVAAITHLVFFSVYTITHSDINRFRGYDRCGNICGIQNVKYEEWNCTGQDMTSKPYLDSSSGECSSNSNDNSDSLETLSSYFVRILGQLVLSSVIPLGLTLIFIALLRYATAVAFWGTLAVSPLACLVMSILLSNSFFIQFTFILGIAFIWSVMQRERVKVVIALYRETWKTVSDIPSLFVVPILTFAALLVIVITFIILFVHMATAGVLKNNDGYLVYVRDNVMTATTFYISPIVTIWLIQFVIGVAYTTVSGAVANWCFSKNRSEVDGIVKISFQTAVRKHPGTIALGSLIISLTTPVRIVLICLAQIWMLNDAVNFLLRYFDAFCTRNVYIMTAIHGTSFIGSGKKAARHLKLNIGRAVVIDRFGDFVITLSQVIVATTTVISTVCMYENLEHAWRYSPFFFTFVFAFAYACIFSFLGILRIAASTLYLCASEDSLITQDSDLLFTVNLKQCVKDSNKLFIKKIQAKNLQQEPEQVVAVD